MSASDLAAAARDLARAVGELADDPQDAVRMLAALAAYAPADPAGDDAVGRAMAGMQAAVGALCRRAALAQLARACVVAKPPSYEAAVALRDRVCGLLEAEGVIAADAGDDASATALRDLRAAVGEDLTRRAADLARLRTVEAPAPLPALVHAWRLYGDLGRADEVAAYAGASDPTGIGGTFQVLGE